MIMMMKIMTMVDLVGYLTMDGDMMMKILTMVGLVGNLT